MTAIPHTTAKRCERTRYDVFVSYTWADKPWVDEELLPLLKQMEVCPFIDDGESRQLREDEAGGEAEDFDNTDGPNGPVGLLVGDEIDASLREAMENSRFILSVLSPNYFSSRSCRKEIHWARNLVKSSKANGPKWWIALIIRKDERGRLDVSDADDDVLYADLSDVAKRALELRRAMMAFQRIGKSPLRLSPRLGACSRRHYMDGLDVRRRYALIEESFRSFRGHVDFLRALKDVHDAVQSGQDAWRTLELDVRRPQEGSREMPGTVEDLKDRLSMVSGKMNDSSFPRNDVSWEAHLERSLAAVNGLLHHQTSERSALRWEEIRVKALETTKAFLFHSTAAMDLSRRIVDACKALGSDWHGPIFEELNSLKALPWNDRIQGEIEQLGSRFEVIREQQSGIEIQVEAHDFLQCIESLLIPVSREGFSEFDFQGCREDVGRAIEELRRLECHYVERIRRNFEWLAGLRMGFRDLTLPEVAEVQRFQRKLTMAFQRADVDLKNEVGKLIGSAESAYDLMKEPARGNQG